MQERCPSLQLIHMKKYLPAVLVSAFILLGLGGAIWYGMRSTDSPRLSASDLMPGTSSVGGAATQLDGNVAPQSGGLSVGGAADGSSLQSNLGQSSGGSSSSSTKSAATPPGPESFSQYEQYKDKDTAMFVDLVEGTGMAVEAGTKVAVTYKGWLSNGTLFDQSSVGEDGKLSAFTFVVGAKTVIPGWEQAIVGMKVGGTRRFVIPPVVGYGSEGHDPVPPNALLVFDVVLHQAL